MRAVALALLALLPPAAHAQVQPYQQNDGLGFHSILPPGQNGTDTALDVAAFQASGARPPNNSDQLGMYQDLVRATPGLSTADIPKYFKDESFGVKPEDVVRTYNPRPDVTIIRDRFGVPHIYSDNIEGTMFGVGYASAEDRLFLMDVFRRVGRGESASFVGGSALEFDSDVFSTAPYKQGELTEQFNRGLQRYGALGEATRKELLAYLDGVNAFIAEARTNPLKMPVEYQALGAPLGPADFEPADIVASSIVLIGVLGVGGGGELQNALALQEARKRFGRKRGTAVYNDFRSSDDPEAPTTVIRKRFIHQKKPRRIAKGSLAMPDRGSVKMLPAIVRDGGAASNAAPGGLKTSAGLGELVRRIVEKRGMSNALLVSAAESESGTAPRRVRSPDRLLRPPAPHRDGYPRAQLRLARRRRDRHPLGGARARPRLRLERDLAGRRHPGHLRGRPLRAEWSQADHRLDALPLPRPVPADRRGREAGLVAVEPGGLDAVGKRHLPGAAHEDRPGRGPRHHQGQARALHPAALQLRARDR